MESGFLWQPKAVALDFKWAIFSFAEILYIQKQPSSESFANRQLDVRVSISNLIW